jgi:uncharacterized membrane protein YfcA
MATPEFVAATLAVALGSIVQAASGVGAGFIMAPLLALIDLSLVPGPLIFGSLSLSGIMTYRERGAIDVEHVPIILGGLLPGSVLGAWLLTSIPVGALGVVFGSVILAAIAITVSGFDLPLSKSTAVACGALSGVMGTSSGMGAPPMALLYQRRGGPQVRSTLALLYTASATLMVLVLIAFRRFTPHDAVAGLLLVPGFLIGYLAANRFTPRLDGRGARIAVLGVSGAAAIVLVLRSLI